MIEYLPFYVIGALFLVCVCWAVYLFVTAEGEPEWQRKEREARVQAQMEETPPPWWLR